MRANECHGCQKAEPEVQLQMCRVCHKFFCEDHAVERSGAAFCSMGCSFYFFNVDPDADDDVD